MARDEADAAILYKHLRIAGIMTVALSEGEINELHVGLTVTQLDQAIARAVTTCTPKKCENCFAAT